MAIDALVKPLLSLPLFRGLKPLQLTEIVRRADRIVFRPGDAIIRADEAGDAAIIIISGEAVRLTDQGSAAERVPEGAMIGELAMLVETIHASTVIAKTAVRALRLSRDEMHALMRDDPALTEHISMQVTARLKRLALQLETLDDALGEFAHSSFQPQMPALPEARPALIH